MSGYSQVASTKGSVVAANDLKDAEDVRFRLEDARTAAAGAISLDGWLAG